MPSACDSERPKDRTADDVDAQEHSGHPANHADEAGRSRVWLSVLAVRPEPQTRTKQSPRKKHQRSHRGKAKDLKPRLVHRDDCCEQNCQRTDGDRKKEPTVTGQLACEQCSDSRGHVEHLGGVRIGWAAQGVAFAT